MVRKFGLLALVCVVALGLSGCTEFMVGNHFYKKASKSGGCVAEGALKVGSPYMVDGERYEPLKSSLGYSEKGIASWYGKDFHGKASANGECYNMYAYTAAHKTLPLPTVVRVTNLENGRSIVLKVNDRGPYVRGRIIDLSYAAAQSLGVVRTGTAPVLVEAIGGPHHVAGGYKGGPVKLANALGKSDIVAETLPSVVPVTANEEDLPPLPKLGANRDVAGAQAAFAERQKIAAVQAEDAQARALGVPDPAKNLPKPPAYKDTPQTDTEPLRHTRVYVQIGAYGEAPRAQAQLAKLKQIDKMADLSPLQLGNGSTLLRVRSGPFGSVAEAEIALQKMLDSGFEGAQIKVEGGEVSPETKATYKPRKRLYHSR